MLVVIIDGWIPDKYFEDDEYETAETYVKWCNYAYQGSYELQRCSDDYPQRFERATMLIATNAP